METFRVAYRSPKTAAKAIRMTDDKYFSEFLAIIVDLQEILGDIHDSDVVLAVLIDYRTQSERSDAAPGIAKAYRSHEGDSKRGLQNIFREMGTTL